MCVIVVTTVFSYFSTPPLIHVCPVSNYFVHHPDFYCASATQLAQVKQNCASKKKSAEGLLSCLPTLSFAPIYIGTYLS